MDNIWLSSFKSNEHYNGGKIKTTSPENIANVYFVTYLLRCEYKLNELTLCELTKNNFYFLCQTSFSNIFDTSKF